MRLNGESFHVMAPFKLDKSAKKGILFAFRVWFIGYETEFGWSFDMTRDVQTLWLLYKDPLPSHKISKNTLAQIGMS